MELQVTVTLSDRLFELLEGKLPNLGRRVEKAITKEIGARVREESGISVNVAPSAPAEETAQAEETAPQTEAPAADEKPKAKPMAARNIPEEVREIIHATRQRFIGEDYKNQTDSDLYKKYYKPLTAEIKKTALALGYDKPSLIDNVDSLDKFRAMCDELTIDNEGNIITKTPF